jgi:predicted dehydrogenase
MKIAVVGLGYWGPNLVRNFSASDRVEEVLCCDLDPHRVKQLVTKFPHVKAVESYEEILKTDCDAVAIATPISRHYTMGMQALRHGKHILVEKPMAVNSRECEEMIRCAEEHDRVILVDHTFLYTGAVRKMKEIVTRGDVGDVYYFDSVRVNLGIFQHDVNVIWDLAPHDLSILDFVLGKRPSAVSAVGVNHYNHMEDVAYLTVHFGEKMMAHVHVNWLAPVKIRRILVGGSKKMILYDDMEPSEKVKVYDSGVKVVTREGIYKTLVEYRTGDMFAPKVDQSEALSLVVDDFLTAIESRRRPTADGETGLRVVRVLEAAERSVRQHGALVHLEQ